MIESINTLYKINDNGCWIWLGKKHYHDYKNCYGYLWFNNKSHYAHRFFYEQIHGQIPKGKVLDHICKNTLCVNPEHLRPVSASFNMLRNEIEKTHCKYGHLLSGNNLIIIKKGGYRRCKICDLRRGKKYRSERA